MKKCVLILFGGRSVEHDISIITALQVAKNMPARFDFRLCYITRDGRWMIAENLTDISVFSDFERRAKRPRQVTFLAGGDTLFCVKGRKISPLFRVECVLNCCHGRDGEDGSVQGLLQCSGVAQTSPQVLPSAVCMDKFFFKEICAAKKISTPKFLVFREGKIAENFIHEAEKKLKFPVVIKPSNLGSSIGISLCKNAEEMKNALDLALKFSSKVLAEEAVVPLREFNCACLKFRGKTHVSHVVEVENRGEFFSFDDKYISKKVEMRDESEIQKRTNFESEIVEKEANVDAKFDENNAKIDSKNVENEAINDSKIVENEAKRDSKIVEKFEENDGKFEENASNFNKNDDEKLFRQVRNLTRQVYDEFELSGIVRVDFLFDSARQMLFVNEVNTIPGSMAFYLFKDVPFSELLGSCIEEAIRQRELQASKITTFSSDALKIFENSTNFAKNGSKK